ncbi:MAG TPA: AI-2E family transporter [Thioalkalivibrio sp.]|nr:AI-2E family transporter [Thioalkalivibrio sp.]
MIEVLQEWYRRFFPEPQVLSFALLLVAGFVLVIYFGKVLAPLLAAVIIAYILDGAVAWLMRLRLPRLLASVIVFGVWLALMLIALVTLGPLLSQQVTQFFGELPKMLSQGHAALLHLPEQYPNLISVQQVNNILAVIQAELTAFGQQVLRFSLASVTGLITLMVYFVLVPLMVFFFLKDKEVIVAWMSGLLPAERQLARDVWHEVNVKIASYIRGKFWEILIVWVVTYVTFKLLGLNYAMLLSFLVGISVIVPYVGAAVVTVPVAFIAYFQWGLGSEFVYVLVAYGIIQFLDGNLLVPLLFSEVVNLHPVAIIAAVLIFGGLWGLWGVFFAIPLATLVNAIIKSWPTAARRARVEAAQARQD